MCTKRDTRVKPGALNYVEIRGRNEGPTKETRKKQPAIQKSRESVVKDRGHKCQKLL